MTLNQIDLSKSNKNTREKLREIASKIEPGKGIKVSEVSVEIGVSSKNTKIHAEALGCYRVVYIGGKAVAFITSL